MSPATDIEHVERQLEQALRGGTEELPHQLQYILAYCQHNDASDRLATKGGSAALTVDGARLQALVNLAASLSPAQVAELYARVQHEADIAQRLDMSSQLLAYLPPAEQNSRAREIWSLLETVNNPLVSIQVLLRLAALTSPVDVVNPSSGALSGALSLAHKIRNAEARVRSLIALANHAPPEIAHQIYRNVLATVRRAPSDPLRQKTLCALARHVPLPIEAEVIRTALNISEPNARARTLTALIHALPDRTELVPEALDAISRIDSEEDRIEALVSLAPALPRHTGDGDYPPVLTQALGIVIEITKRPLRARGLVALSPVVSTDLQGETLAALNSLTNERDRAALLAEFAPSLSPNMLVACLVIAHTMREQDSRAYALGVLAHHVPPQAREQTVLDAFAAASNLHNLYERVTALLSLVDVLPEKLRDQAFTNALEATRLIDNENARARALSQLGQHLPDALLSRALEMTYQLTHQEQKLNTLVSLFPRLTPHERQNAVRHVFAIIQHMPFEFKRARALILLSGHLSPAEIAQAFTLTEALTDPLDRFNATVALAQNLPPARRADDIQRAWRLVPEIEEGYDRAGALVAIAPFLPPDAKPDLRRLALEVIQTIDDDYDRASAITLLAAVFGDNPYGEMALSPMPDAPTLTAHAVRATLSLPDPAARLSLLRQAIPLWCQLEANQRYHLWREALRRLKALPLADALLCLSLMQPVVVSLGGKDAQAYLNHLLVGWLPDPPHVANGQPTSAADQPVQPTIDR